MVRIGSRAPSTGRAPSVSKLRKNRDKPYKVQLESVMAKKKKLKLHDIHGSAKPLDGYTFLPVGFSDLAEECKEISRKKDADVAVVSAGSRTIHNDPLKLSHHVHRVGYHFRTDIFDEACNKLGYCERNGRLEKITGMQSSHFERTMSGYGSRFDMVDVNNRSEEESLKVKKHIRELFPKIPETDLEEIYIRAWEQGAKTVGNAGDLSLSRQVQLATIARIRHTYTEYDHLLRVGSWRDARTQVERKCLSKLIEWRGEHDNDPEEEFEEILRETIVIDDESDDEDDMEIQDEEAGSDSSLEIVQHTIAPKDLRVDPHEASNTSRFADSRKRTQNRVFPAAVQARWQNARSEQYGNKALQPATNPMDRITVALDNQGNAPRTLQTGGVQYVRISPDAEPAQRYPVVPTARIPGLTGPTSTANRYVVQDGNRVPQSQYHNSHAWAGNRNLQAPYPPPTERTYEHAVQSIEKPHDAAPLHGPRVIHHEGPSLIDLTTPPKPRPQGEYANMASINTAYGARPQHAATWNHAPERDDHVVFLHARPRSQVPITAPVQNKPMLQRHHSGLDVIDLTRNREHMTPVAGRPSYPQHGAAQHTRPIALDRMYRQPVYGQAAFPQMRSQFTPAPAPAPATPPRPVHGAPSRLQPVPTFEMVSSPRQFSGLNHLNQPAYRIPDT